MGSGVELFDGLGCLGWECFYQCECGAGLCEWDGGVLAVEPSWVVRYIPLSFLFHIPFGRQAWSMLEQHENEEKGSGEKGD